MGVPEESTKTQRQIGGGFDGDASRFEKVAGMRESGEGGSSVAEAVEEDE